jgi:hypothetical protein
VQSVNEVTHNKIYICNGEVIVVFGRNEDIGSERCLSIIAIWSFSLQQLKKIFISRPINKRKSGRVGISKGNKKANKEP